MEDDGTSTRMDNPRKVLFEKDNQVASKGKKVQTEEKKNYDVFKFGTEA